MKKHISVQTLILQQKVTIKIKQKQLVKSQYAQKYEEVMKAVNLPKPYEYYIEKLISNQIYLDPKSISDSMKVFIVEKSPTGTVMKLRVSFGFFTLQIMVLNFEHCSQLHSYVPISSGGFGKIYLVKFRNIESAVKCLELRRQSQEWGKGWEFSFLIALKQYCLYKICSALQVGPKITKVFGFDLICMKDCIQFSMEICSKNKKTQEQNNYLEMLKVLHTFHILHRDIKPDNIMYSHCYAKQVFVDFGASTFISQQIGYASKCSSIVGTTSYMGPQMYKIWLNYHKNPYLFQIGRQFIDYYFNDLCGVSMVLRTQASDKLEQDQQNLVKQQKIQIGCQSSTALIYLFFCVQTFKRQEIQHYKPLLKNYSKQIQEHMRNCFQVQYYKKIIWECLFSGIQYTINSQKCKQQTKIINKYLEIENQQILWDEQIDKQIFIKFYGNIMANISVKQKQTSDTIQLLQNLIIEIYNQSILNSLRCFLLKKCFQKLVSLLEPQTYLKEQNIVKESQQSQFSIFYCLQCKGIKMLEKYSQNKAFLQLRQKALSLLADYVNKHRSKFNAQTFKRFQLINLCRTSEQDFYKGVIDYQADPYNAIDYYFRLLAVNINLVKINRVTISNILGKHFQKIEERYRKLILRLISIVDDQMNYDLLISSTAFLQSFGLEHFLKNKMPFVYLQSVTILSKLYFFYGYFNCFRSVQNSVLAYLQDFPSNLYYMYAKIDFYCLFNDFYQANYNVVKAIYYAHEIDRTKKIVHKNFVESILIDQRIQGKEDKVCHNNIYAMKLNFKILAKTKSQVATQIRKCKSLYDFKNINFQQVRLYIESIQTAFVQNILRQIKKNDCNFSFKRYEDQIIKFYMNCLDCCQSEINKQELYISILNNYIKWINQKPITNYQTANSQLMELQKQYGVFMGEKDRYLLRIGSLLMTQQSKSTKQILSLKWSKEDLISSPLSKTVFQNIGAKLFFGQDTEQRILGKKILLTFIQLFLQKKIGNLTPIEMAFLPYIRVVEQEKKSELIFILLKNQIQLFHYTGSKIVMMNIMYFPSYFSDFMNERSKQILFQQIIASQFFSKPQLIEFGPVYASIIDYFYGNDFEKEKKLIFQIITLIPKIAKCSTLILYPLIYFHLWKVYTQQKRNYNLRKLSQDKTLFKQKQFRSTRKNYYLFKLCEVKLFCVCPWPKFARDISKIYENSSKCFFQFSQDVPLKQYKNKWNCHINFYNLRKKKLHQVKIVQKINKKLVQHYMNLDRIRIKK